MASPDKSLVFNILKEFEQSSYNTRPENIVVEESNENPQGPGDQDQPPKWLSVEEDLTRSNSWDTLKAPITPSAWRTVKKPWQETVKFDYKEKEAMEIQLDRRERELERQERELDRRSREIDRRERELERRQREFDRDRVRCATEINTTPQWTTAIEALKNKIDSIVIKERTYSEQRELELEARVMRKVNEALEREHQIMQMSDNEVNEMIEDTVGYLLQKDEDIADRVRFQSLVYLAQEKLAIEAGLQPGPALEPLPTVWIMAVGPSVVTEDRYNKAMDILKKGYETFSDATMALIDCKPAMEFLVEYTSHLKKEGLERSFAPGRIPREAYIESIDRQVKQSGVNGAALAIVVNFVCQDPENSVKPFESAKPSQSKPSEPAKPSEPKPSEPAELFESKPSEPAMPSKSNPSEPAKPSEPKPSEPAKPIESKPSEPAKPFESKPSEPAKPFESKSSEPAKPSEPSEACGP